MTMITIERETLLPCPFCGKQPRIADLAGWEILCDCGVDMCLPDDASREGVTAAWNRRAALAQPAEPVACEHKRARWNIQFTSSTCMDCESTWSASKGWTAQPALPQCRGAITSSSASGRGGSAQ